MNFAISKLLSVRQASVLVRAVLITALTTGVLAALLSWQGANLAQKVARAGISKIPPQIAPLAVVCKTTKIGF